ncbi:MAG: hypothetical protein U0Y68_11070 [Blastocatellia bacterium]
MWLPRQRTTLRSLAHQSELSAALRNGGAENIERLSLVAADLAEDAPLG